MSDPIESFVNLEWLMDNPQLPLDFNIPLPINPTADIDISTVSNSELFQYYLDGEMSAMNYEHSAVDPQLDAISTGGVISPTDLLKPSISSGFYGSPSPTSSHADSEFDMSDIKKEPSEFFEEISSRAAATLRVTSMASKLVSDKEPLPSPVEEHHDDEDRPIDPKKLTSKEKRQLRNKISARNFRVRRKEYISTLETQVHFHQNEAKELREKLLASDIENEKLRVENHKLRVSASSAAAEIEQLRKSIRDLHAGQVPPSPVSPPNEYIKSPKPRASPPLSKPNLKKDVSINGTGPGFTDNSRILVSSLEVPEWDLQKILGEDLSRKEGLSEKQPSRAETSSGVLSDPSIYSGLEDIMMASLAQTVFLTVIEHWFCMKMIESHVLGNALRV